MKEGKIMLDRPAWTLNALEHGIALDVPELNSVALSRLVDEVRNGVGSQTNAYNRTYHRHNR